MDVGVLGPSALLLAAGVLLDLVFGDPQWRWHPIRLIGHAIAWIERGLRGMGLDGHVGGVALGLTTAAVSVAAASALLLAAERLGHVAGLALHALVIYSILALRDLLDHAGAVEAAARSGDLARVRDATARFVARSTGNLDIAGCRRAAIESVSENLTDGYVSPLCWYVLAGIPGLVAFKAFSTLDSMVGYRSERYLRFGWFSARTDDLLNWIPARLTWLLVAVVAAFVPGCSARRALAVGWRQHAVVPGPNSGWSEAATAGAIRRRLVGPIFADGQKVTDVWLGDGKAPPAGEAAADLPRAMVLHAATGLLAAGLAIALLALLH